MNTNITFQAYSDMSDSSVLDIFQNGFKRFEYVVKNFSRFDEKSELTKLNRSGGKLVKVSKELFDLIDFSINIAKATKGYFDPTVIDILEAYGYDSKYSFEKLNNKTLVEKEIVEIMKTRSKYTDIKLVRRENKSTNKPEYYIKLMKNQRIDLGGCGKGYAIDLAYEELSKNISNFLIDAGGDIRVKGRDVGTEKKWRIGLFNPDDPSKPLGHLDLDSGEALACSGSWARKVKYFHHLIDMKMGKPKEGIKIVFVKSDRAIIADAYSTAAYVMGKEIHKILPKNVMLKIIEE